MTAEAAQIAIMAGAGAGKTTRITSRYVNHVVHENLSPLEIVAVTFTDAAALELRSRVREKLTEALDPDDDRLAELEAARISTFHSLAAAICRQHSVEAGVPGDFAILDEVQGALWLADRVDDALDTVPDKLFNRVGFSRMRTLTRKLIEDPISTGEAFSKSYRSWRDTVKYASQAARVNLTSSDTWRESLALLISVQGANGDNFEPVRAQVVTVMQAIDSGADFAENAAVIAAVKTQAGSARNWPDMKAVKTAVTSVRELVREAIAEGLIEMRAGEVDRDMLRQVRDVRKAYEIVQARLLEAKIRERLLDYSDLEVHALRALKEQRVRDYYHARWRAFLVDEYQDTNRVQEQILSLIMPPTSRRAIVGDPNQSIYGFRRADPTLILKTTVDIVEAGGERELLGTNYRTHSTLVALTNGMFTALFTDSQFVPQKAVRGAPNEVSQWLQVCRIELAEDEKAARTNQTRAEALNAARMLRDLMAAGTLVHDRETKLLRPMEWRDVAVISRAWASLDLFADALSSLGIPSVLMGGGNLMLTREAKDGAALLRFLADPQDDLALAAVLKSPLFTVSDDQLYSLRLLGTSLLESLSGCDELREQYRIISVLMEHRSHEAPSRLLHRAEVMTGITAVLLSLPSGERRLADWRGFVGLVEEIEKTSFDAFSVARVLRRINKSLSDRAGGVEIPRPALEPGNAVGLMSIHRSKGLEWPIVILPDMTRQSPPDNTEMHLDPELGVALKAAGVDTKDQPMLFQYLRSRKKTSESEEDKRLLYVSATRARDYLFITSAAPGKSETGLMKHFAPVLDVVKAPAVKWAYKEGDGQPPKPRSVVQTFASPEECLGPITAPLSLLPATGISSYSNCPKQFEYRYVNGHPGIGEGDDLPGRIGTLTHIAIQFAIERPEVLQRYDRTLGAEHVMAAIRKADQYRSDPRFARYRDAASEHEVAVSFKIGEMMVTGRIDLLGPDFILDFKTGRRDAEAQHIVQLWLYAEAVNRDEMVICYFDGKLPTVLHRSEMPEMRGDVERMLGSIRAGKFAADPDPAKCGACRYKTICAESAAPPTPGVHL